MWTERVLALLNRASSNGLSYVENGEVLERYDPTVKPKWIEAAGQLYKLMTQKHDFESFILRLTPSRQYLVLELLSEKDFGVGISSSKTSNIYSLLLGHHLIPLENSTPEEQEIFCHRRELFYENAFRLTIASKPLFNSLDPFIQYGIPFISEQQDKCVAGTYIANVVSKLNVRDSGQLFNIHQGFFEEMGIRRSRPKPPSVPNRFGRQYPLVRIGEGES